MSIIDIFPPVGFECGFQNTLNFHNRKYCFKYEYADRGRRCMLIGDDKDCFIQWFQSLPEKDRKLYELIREEDIVAEYYDIDYPLNDLYNTDEWDEKDVIENIKDYIDSYSHHIIQVILDTRNKLSQQTISKKDLIVLSAHTSSKLSLHIISKKTYFRSNKLQFIFANDVYKSITEQNECFNIDTSVYSKNRCFRMYLNHKYEKDNKLILFYPQMYSFATFEETWVVLTHQDISQRDEIKKYDENDLIVYQQHEHNEILTEDLDELLQQFLKNHSYLHATKSSHIGLNRINRIEHTTRPCLTDSTDQHSTENMYWYINNNKLYVHCFCKKGKPICLGMRKGIHQIQLEPEQFNYGTHTSDDFKSYEDCQPNITTIYDKRRTGKGKTTCAMQYASKFERVLLVHHRLSLDADYITKYPEFTSYQNGTNSIKQTVCFNSLSKIDIRQYDLIIIDEIRSILKQTEMKDMIHSTHTLFNIFENKKIPLVMLDANLTNTDIEFIDKYRPDNNRIVIHDQVESTSKCVYIIHQSHEMDLLMRIDQCIQQQQKVVIIYNRSIQTMNSLLSPYINEYRILHINKNTRTSIDMNSENWYDDYDIIAYSPTISEGFSITDKRFEQVHAFGLFTSTSCPAESVSQMIARFRAIDNFTIHIDTTHTKAIPLFHAKEDVLNYINANISRLHLITQGHYNVQRTNSKLQIIEDEFCELYCKNMLEQSLDYHNYQQTLIQKLINNGYQVFEDLNSTLTEEQMKDTKKTIDILKKDEKERIQDKILNSPNISSIEYNQLIDAGINNEEDDCKVQKYNIIHSINIKPNVLTREMIQKFNNSNVRAIIRNIKQCFAFIRNETGQIERIPVDVLIRENAFNQTNIFEQQTNFLDQKRIATNFSIAKLEWMNERIKELGFQYLFSPEGIDMNTFNSNMDKILHYYSHPNHYNTYVDTELLFGKKTTKQSQTTLTKSFITQKLNSILGLKLVLDKNQNKIFQQVSLDLRLYDETQEFPNLLGHILLPNDIVQQYNCMFMRNLMGKYCNICQKEIANGINFKHLNSTSHKKAEQQQ